MTIRLKRKLKLWPFDECVAYMPPEDLNRQQAKQFTCFFDVYIFERAFRSEFFCWISFQKNLTDLKTNFTKFELSTAFLCRGINKLDFSIERLFTLKTLLGLPTRNKTLKKLLHVLDSQYIFCGRAIIVKQRKV